MDAMILIGVQFMLGKIGGGRCRFETVEGLSRLELASQFGKIAAGSILHLGASIPVLLLHLHHSPLFNSDFKCYSCDLQAKFFGAFQRSFTYSDECTTEISHYSLR